MAVAANIRVRFAPSPTGFLHVGGLRTALYNFLFARGKNGTFILRIEDTDRSRYVPGAVENLLEVLRWAGIEPDEGPMKGGPFGPYVQSERLEIYRKHISTLLEAGSAYRCFCTPERLEEMRKAQEKVKATPRYDRHCLALTPEAVQDNLSKKLPFVVRMLVPREAPVSFVDLIRQRVEFSADSLDDQVLLKSDGYPTYHLANVVDDHLMGITHVIRGEEWLPSTPKHVLLYDFFGWEKPAFAHLPLLLNPDRSKLSKRQGDVAAEEYRARGYLSEALTNFVALLGWNPGTEQEIFSLEELISQFSIERVNKAGAIFDIEKLNWLNFEHLRRMPDESVLKMMKVLLASKFGKLQFSDESLLKVLKAMRERMTFVRDVVEKSPYFFEPPATYEEDAVRKRWKKETPSHLAVLADAFEAQAGSGKGDFESSLQSTARKLAVGNGSLIHAVRLSVTGVSGGPGLYEILEILGKDESVRRIRTAIEKIR